MIMIKISPDASHEVNNSVIKDDMSWWVLVNDPLASDAPGNFHAHFVNWINFFSWPAFIHMTPFKKVVDLKKKLWIWNTSRFEGFRFIICWINMYEYFSIWVGEWQVQQIMFIRV